MAVKSEATPPLRWGTLSGARWLIMYTVGLAFIYGAKRIAGADSPVGWGLLVGGLGLMALASVSWLLAYLKAKHPNQRRVERLSTTLCLVGWLGIGFYFLGAEMGVADAALTDGRSVGLPQIISVLWPVVLICGLLPAIFVQWSASSMSGPQTIELFRIYASARSGAVIASTLCTLFILNAAANRKDVHVDLSHAKLGTPSESTRSLITGLDHDTQALLFFAKTDETLPMVRAYFKALGPLSTHFGINIIDPATAPEQIDKYRVTSASTVVIARGDRYETIRVGAKFKQARRRLSKFDGQIQSAILKLTLKRKTVYFITGHGERNTRSRGEDTKPTMSLLAQFIEGNNLTVEDLGAAEGLASDVPDDAALLIWLDPKTALLPGEASALWRYLNRGGRLLLTLDPDSNPELDPFLAELGLTYSRVPLANDTAYLPLRRIPQDRYNIVTNVFSAHPSVTQLSKSRNRVLLMAPKTGSLATTTQTTDGNRPRVTFTVRTKDTTWSDTNGDTTRNNDEKTATHQLVAAVSRAVDSPNESSITREMRAIVMADTDLLSDDYIGFRIGRQGQPGNLQLLVDTTKWLLDEPRVGQVIESQSDARIVHTRQSDVGWFYATVFAVPGAILIIGISTRFGRRRRRDTKEPR